MNILEIENIIDDLNQEIFDVTESEDIYMEVSSNSYGIVILFLNIQLWSTEDDEREFVNENTSEIDYEPLEGFLRREVNRKIDKIKRIRL